MLGWPLPFVLLGHENMMVVALTELLLLAPVIFVNGSPSEFAPVPAGHSSFAMTEFVYSILHTGWLRRSLDVPAPMEKQGLYFAA